MLAGCIFFFSLFFCWFLYMQCKRSQVHYLLMKSTIYMQRSSSYIYIYIYYILVGHAPLKKKMVGNTYALIKMCGHRLRRDQAKLLFQPTVFVLNLCVIQHIIELSYHWVSPLLQYFLEYFLNLLSIIRFSDTECLEFTFFFFFFFSVRIYLLYLSDYSIIEDHSVDQSQQAQTRFDHACQTEAIKIDQDSQQ